MSTNTEQLKCIKQYQSFGGCVKFYTHSSKSTQTPMNFSVYCPPQSQMEKVPVLLWLSGLTCTEENFMAKAGAQQWASAKEIMIVCPDTSPRGTDIKGEHDHWDFGSGAGFYLNATTDLWKNHYRMYDYVTKELPALIHDHLPADCSRLSIAGHSMGGHGAITIGLKNPDIFKSISAFSPICSPIDCPWGQKAFQGYLGDNRQAWKQYDSCELIKTAQEHLPLLIDQGTADEFLKEQLKPELLLEAGRQANYEMTFRMQEGYDHSYYFISTFIKDHIDFHSQYLKS